MRVDPRATTTSKVHTLAPKLLKCKATFYISKLKENCAIKQDCVLAQHRKKPFTATLEKIT
jgi:hypothetical protein